MGAAIYTNWSLFGVLGLAVFARVLEGLSHRAIAIGPVAGLGAAMFIISTICMNAWMNAETLSDQLWLWRHGIALDALLYLAILLWLAPRHLVVAALPILMIAGAYFITMGDYSAGTKQIAEGLQMWVIAGLCWLCFASVKKDDLIGILLWGVLAVNEVASAAAYTDCQFLHGLFGLREAGSACAQVYGVDYTMWFMIPSALLCTWFLARWFWPRHR